MELYQPSERFWLWMIRGIIIISAIFLLLGLKNTCTTGFAFGNAHYFFFIIIEFIFPLSFISLLLPRKCSAMVMMLSIVSLTAALSYLLQDHSYFGQLNFFIYSVLQVPLFYSALRCWLIEPAKNKQMVNSSIIFIAYLFIVHSTMLYVLVSRIASNETTTVGTIRTIQKCAKEYKQGNVSGYPISIDQIQSNKCLVREFDNKINHGYLFSYQPKRSINNNEITGFTVTAMPSDYGGSCDSEQRSFFGDETGRITFSNGSRPACATDKPL